MRIVMLAVGAAGLLAGTSAMAQQAATQPAGSDVNSYLCAFAGKCDSNASAAEDTPTRAAPATKGFRLAAAAQQTPTTAAPATRGFRLATGTTATTSTTVAAPTTRSFHIARPTSAVTTTTPVAVAQPRATRPSSRRFVATTVAPAARPAPTPGAARADLMLTFDLNSSNMTPAAEARARTFAQALMMDELRGKRFLIEGHTDARGSRQANIDLSRRRAQSVADFLVSQGVDRGRVEVRGVGPDEPLPGRASPDQNRRVEAVLLS